VVKRRQAAGAIANGATVHAATSFMQPTMISSIIISIYTKRFYLSFVEYCQKLNELTNLYANVSY
jgi:hypothetical protein